MKVVEYIGYGEPEVLRFKEVKKPVPGKNQVLIRIHATSVTAGDSRMRRADPWFVRLINGPFKPMFWKILGMELAGVVEETGSKVTKFNVGDRVYGFSGFGAYAEYRCRPAEKALALIPENLSFEEAATVPVGANTALYFLKEKAGIKKGDKVMIYGASGSVGTYAVQLARHFGAEITAVCSTANLDLVRSLGAHHVIDYTKEKLGNRKETYDILFDTIGIYSEKDIKHLLGDNGRFVTVDKGLARGTTENLEFLNPLLEDGSIKPVIDRTFSLDEIQDAHRYVDQFRKKGNVSIQVINSE